MLGYTQPTVGLKVIENEVQDGYTLFTPLDSRFTFLIDNCGNLVNQWESVSKSNFSVYLLEDGSLLRPTREGGNTFLEIRDWEDNLTWKISFSTLNITQHHDVEPLPNGNILVIANDPIAVQQAVNAGRDPTDLIGNIISESVYEIEPIGTDEANIVWEWHMFDHLIQDYDSTKANYGIVEDHPELVDFNFNSPALTFIVDWLHFNSIDYNPELDQILLSSRHNNEIYIIDHSTTTEEAAGHTGGNAGKGGDLLFRWGNPIVYRKGEWSDEQLFGQHHANWVNFDNVYENRIALFNNGYLRPDDVYSTAEILTISPDEYGNYPLNENGRFLPDSVSFEYKGEVQDLTMVSSILSSAQLQPNGNLLLCEGLSGRFIEIDEQGELKWLYQNPVASIFFSQGDFPNGTRAFRAEKYPPNYPAFIDKDLTTDTPIEMSNIISEACAQTVEVEMERNNQINIYPIPFKNEFQINSDQLIETIEIYNIEGTQYSNKAIKANQIKYSTLPWPKGIYYSKIKLYGNDKPLIKKMLKQ